MNGTSPYRYVAVTSASPQSSVSRIADQLGNLLKTQSGLTLLGCLIVVGVFSAISGARKKGKIATSYWGGSKERAAAQKKATKQMKKTTRNNVALYVGMPQQMRSKLQAEWRSQGLLKTSSGREWTQVLPSLNASPTLYVPDAQRGIAAIGAAGSGKTFSVIDPLIRSAFDQGFPVCLYDFKFPAQTKRAVAYAMKRGYTVRVFAPGFLESEVCNPLDLIKDEEDAISAAQLAQVVSKNFNKGGADGGDKFFEEAGDSLVEGILLVTKAIATLTGDDKYCDLMTAQAILSLPKLPARLEAASKSKLKVWTTRPLSVDRKLWRLP